MRMRMDRSKEVDDGKDRKDGSMDGSMDRWMDGWMAEHRRGHAR